MVCYGSGERDAPHSSVSALDPVAFEDFAFRELVQSGLAFSFRAGQLKMTVPVVLAAIFDPALVVVVGNDNIVLVDSYFIAGRFGVGSLLAVVKRVDGAIVPNGHGITLVQVIGVINLSGGCDRIGRSVLNDWMQL